MEMQPDLVVPVHAPAQGLSFLYDEQHLTMSTRRKVHFPISCILAITVIGAVVAGCGKSHGPSPDSSTPVKTETRTTSTAAVTTPARPETPLPDPYFRL